MFEVKDLEIEINFVVQQDVGSQLSLVPIGADTKVSAQQTQKIKLTLSPRLI